MTEGGKGHQYKTVYITAFFCKSVLCQIFILFYWLSGCTWWNQTAPGIHIHSVFCIFPRSTSLKNGGSDLDWGLWFSVQESWWLLGTEVGLHSAELFWKISAVGRISDWGTVLIARLMMKLILDRCWNVLNHPDSTSRDGSTETNKPNK